MRKKKLLWVIIFLMISGGCVEGQKKRGVEIKTPPEVKADKQQVPDYFDSEFEDGMVGTAFEYYLYLSTALVLQDTDGAGTAASNLAESFTVERETLKRIAERIAESTDLSKQREYFSEFSSEFEPLLSMSIKSGTIYKQSCESALENVGAFWFSDARKVQNPYTKDIHCGSITDIITQN